MFQAWLDMWKNTFRYSGTVSRKGYWLGLIMNIIFMYVGAIPCALVAMLIGNIPITVAAYLILIHFPAVSLYFRRARHAGWKAGTAAYLAVTIPVLSGLIVGVISNCGTVKKGHSLLAKAFALSFGLFFYGGVLGILFYGDPTAIPMLPIMGLLLASSILIVYGIVHWKEVLAVFFGSGTD